MIIFLIFKFCRHCRQNLKNEDSYPYPGCLVYGVNLNNEIIHIVCGIDEENLWIITAYYPDSEEWEKDMKTRKEKK